MAVLKDIKENLKVISNIETITLSYQEIASLRMNKIRQNVLNNREFIESLSQVYSRVKKSYLLSFRKQPKTKKSFLKKRLRKKIVVFLSSNERFHGSLILDIWREVLDFLQKNKADLAVIGKMGKYLAEKSGRGSKMFYFEFNDDNPEKERVKEIIEFIKNYEEIIVFHGRFRTILSQEVAQSKISGEFILEEGKDVKSYLFEPSPETIFEFFETELISAFFNQAILEHQLSRYATKMIAMYQANQNAKKQKQELKRKQKRLELQLFNKKQIELFSGYPLWS